MKTLWERLYIVKRNQTQMLLRRGYTLSDAAVMDMSYEDFYKYYSQLLIDQGKTEEDLCTVLNTEIEDPSKIIVWYIHTQGKDVPIEDVRIFLDHITGKDGTTVFKHSILISNQKLGAKPSQTLEAMPLFEVEHFTYDELSYDPTSHFLASKHTRLSIDETKHFLKENKILLSQLPTIYDKDPIVKYYNYHIGDLIFIERNSLIGFVPEHSICYRLVVRATR